MLVRSIDSSFNLANIMKTHIYSAFSTLKIGIDLLKKNEDIEINSIYGHGGIFKTTKVILMKLLIKILILSKLNQMKRK